MTLVSSGTGPIYKCGRCGGIFASATTLHEHRETCAGNDDPNSSGGSGSDPDSQYTCGMCGQMFSSSTALGAHAPGCHRDAAAQAGG
jgi:DNA-directed RNA polymerase subunit RPC12/RpoP